LEIRRLQSNELDLLASAIQLLVPEEDRSNDVDRVGHLQRALARHDCYFVVCLANSIPVGYLSAYCFPNVENADLHVYLFDIIVDERHQRTGIATRLIEELKRQCLADGVARIWVGTELENTAAQRLYERTGGKKSETCVEYIYELDRQPPTIPSIQLRAGDRRPPKQNQEL
jgi:ribosomal protein S18 acetylase RimI-like enzyme